MKLLLLAFLALASMGSGTSCAPKKSDALDQLKKVRMTIRGQAFELWVAEDDRTRMRGLMFVTPEQMSPLPDGTERGMVFLFAHSQQSSFWMKDTIIPLDIAYVARDGTVVSMFTMTPLDVRHGRYSPAAPYRFAIEARGGRLFELGLKPGDHLDIPSGLLKG